MLLIVLLFCLHILLLTARVDSQDGYFTFTDNIIPEGEGTKYEGIFYVRVISDHGYKVCDGTFVFTDLETFSCPYDNTALVQGHNTFYITIMSADKKDTILETETTLWYDTETASQRTSQGENMTKTEEVVIDGFIFGCAVLGSYKLLNYWFGNGTHVNRTSGTSIARPPPTPPPPPPPRFKLLNRIVGHKDPVEIGKTHSKRNIFQDVRKYFN